MYPREFFDTYWRTTLKPAVFVAMPFADEFTPVWEVAIKPAIEIDLNDSGQRFTAHRADISKISDSIHTEILDGIAHSTLIFGDISIMATGDDWNGQRNGNVMYEIGIAQTIRPATDIILVRSDTGKIMFDVSHIRITEYDRGNLVAARKQFAECLTEAVKERKNKKSLLTQRLRDRLDAESMKLMVKVFRRKHNFETFRMPSPHYTDGERQTAIRLLDLGIFRCVTPEDLRYQYVWTDFGRDCYAHPNRE